MLALIDPPGVAFVGVPKCMSTSIGRILYEFAYGRPYNAREHGGRYVHGFLSREALAHVARIEPPDWPALERFWTFTVIRDPIKRALSVYTHRVVHQRDIEVEAAKPGWVARNADLAGRFDTMPGPDEFFENLDLYRNRIASIGHHIAPYAEVLGNDLSRFDRVFRIDQAAEIEAALSDRLGRRIRLPNAQRSPSRLQLSDLGPRARQAIEAHTAGDYDLIHPIYPRRRIGAEATVARPDQPTNAGPQKEAGSGHSR